MAFSDFTYFDAKMEKFPFSLFSERNSSIAELAGYTIGLSPYANNKITLAEYANYNLYPNGFRAGKPFAISANPAFTAGAPGGNAPMVGGLVGVTKTKTDFFNDISPYIPKSPVYYYEFQTVADFYKNEFANIDNYIFLRAHPFIGISPTVVTGVDLDGERRGVTMFVTSLSSLPTVGNAPPYSERITDLNALGGRIIITKFILYDGELPRKPITSLAISPTMFFSGATTFEWSSSSGSATKQYRNDIKIAFPFNPVTPNAGLDVTFNGYNKNVNLFFNNLPMLDSAFMAAVVRDKKYYNFMVAKLLTGNDDIMCIAPHSRSYVVNDVDVYSRMYYPLSGVFQTVNYPVFALPASARTSMTFKSTLEFEKMCADWGLHVTNNVNDAKNTPIDFFPDAGGGGTVPDGGNATGYPTNNTPTIPSFPDNTTDIIDENPPNVSALSCAGVYALNLPNAKSLLQWLMTDDYTNNISNLFADKLSALGDLKIFPFDIAAHDPAHAPAQNVLTVGNVSTDTVTNHRILDGYNTWINGGEYSYTAYYGDFNDYEHCTYSLFIPYVGVIDIDAGDVVNKKLRLSYAVDLISGNATAIVYSNDVVVKSIPASMAVSVPLTFTNTNQRQINNALTALSIGNNLLNAGMSSLSSGTPMPLFSSLTSGLNSALINTFTNPLKTMHAGGFGNGTGLSLSQTAFLIITRQIIASPTGYKSDVGIPATYRGKISEFVGSGFVSISADRIDIDATQNERDMILSALARGVYL